ncbi:hypothetical protein F8388_018790 [Cannabis sativa]|uniref:Uncharacterized protein n=1 Tax=Cannabis sativa TaxID=3483 RepID=A0A7J6GMN6_CANSA|nr:hypothetical protein F8388_018790 [Cannabis sativa]
MFSNSLRGRLVDRLPFPDTKEALFEVRLEEARRHVMLTHSEIGDRFIRRRFVQKFYDRALTIGLQGYAKLYVHFPLQFSG